MDKHSSEMFLREGERFESRCVCVKRSSNDWTFIRNKWMRTILKSNTFPTFTTIHPTQSPERLNRIEDFSWNDFRICRLGLMSSLIAGRYPVGIGVGGVFFPSTLQHLHQQQQHQHHSRLAAASSALSNAVQVTGQSDIVDADGIRGVLPGGAGWPFPWRPTHGLQTLEHPSPSDVVGTLSRVSPASASFPQRGEWWNVDVSKESNCNCTNNYAIWNYRNPKRDIIFTIFRFVGSR